jgi:hypothetical protein
MLYRAEATYTNLIVFGLTWLGFEPMIYCSQGEHANHYITDAVHIWLIEARKEYTQYN